MNYFPEPIGGPSWQHQSNACQLVTVRYTTSNDQTFWHIRYINDEINEDGESTTGDLHFEEYVAEMIECGYLKDTRGSDIRVNISLGLDYERNDGSIYHSPRTFRGTLDELFEFARKLDVEFGKEVEARAFPRRQRARKEYLAAAYASLGVLSPQKKFDDAMRQLRAFDNYVQKKETIALSFMIPGFVLSGGAVLAGTGLAIGNNLCGSRSSECISSGVSAAIAGAVVSGMVGYVGSILLPTEWDDSHQQELAADARRLGAELGLASQP